MFFVYPASVFTKDTFEMQRRHELVVTDLIHSKTPPFTVGFRKCTEIRGKLVG